MPLYIIGLLENYDLYGLKNTIILNLKSHWFSSVCCDIDIIEFLHILIINSNATGMYCFISFYTEM